MGDLLAGADCEVVTIPSLGRELRAGRDIATGRALWDVMRRVRPDVVHTHKAKAGAIGRTVAALARVPVRVHTFHGHVFRGYFSPRKTQVFLNIERARRSGVDAPHRAVRGARATSSADEFHDRAASEVRGRAARPAARALLVAAPAPGDAARRARAAARAGAWSGSSGRMVPGEGPRHLRPRGALIAGQSLRRRLRPRRRRRARGVGARDDRRARHRGAHPPARLAARHRDDLHPDLDVGGGGGGGRR